MHEDTSSRDGERVLVDRRCPRGMSKERAHLDERLRDAAPPRTRAGQHRTLSAITWRRSGSRCRGVKHALPSKKALPGEGSQWRPRQDSNLRPSA
ncbi:hypothetical protein ACGFWD_11995 [Streptomyces sp. NPDC048448]|uniref:DUF488 family protein, N3 subclade n=1 Tax=Streptomyces sp. NPDC048448 TaxID=3365554 RepID=UPI0037218375